MNAVLASTDKQSHRDNRAPRRNTGFSWGRFNLHGRVMYRLFRRDLNRKLHVEARGFDYRTDRSRIAAEIWRARIQLREAVDAVDLKHLGVL